MNILEQHCEWVDASVFSGDLLYDDERRAILKEYVGRWQRAISEHETDEEQEGGVMNCETCEHKQNHQGGHCYMFEREPAICRAHTQGLSAGAIGSVQKAPIRLQRPVLKEKEE